MSSEISINKVRPKPDGATGDLGVQADRGLEPWQFFVLAALGCATAVTFMARDQGPTAIILLGLLMGTAALVGYAALRALRPLVSNEEDRTVMVGQRTRVALEREKLMTLRSIKELEFDRAMGRLSDEDWKEMSGRLRSRVARLMRQLDAGAGYRDQIERDLAKRIESAPDARLKGSRSEEGPPHSEEGRSRSEEGPPHSEEGRSRSEEGPPRSEEGRSRSEEAPSPREESRSASLSGERVCASCDTTNDTDAKFCKSCGQPLAAR